MAAVAASPAVAAEAAVAALGNPLDSQFSIFNFQLSMQLLIDIGNTSAKLAVMDSDIVHFERRYEPWGGTFARLMAAYPITDVRLSTVAGEDDELDAAFATLDTHVLRLTPSVP